MKQPKLKTYYNIITTKFGTNHIHTILAENVREAYIINEQRKKEAAKKGNTIKGRLNLIH